MERARGLGIRMGDQFRAPGRCHLRYVVHLRRHGQGTVADDDSQQHRGEHICRHALSDAWSGLQRRAVQPGRGERDRVGIATLTFSDANDGSFAYVVNGISQAKAITRQVFAAPPACTFGALPVLTFATNFQDLWWGAPAGSESGWGVNFTHQGDIIFATWFTYDVDGTPLWLSAAAAKTGPGVYSGTLIERRVRRSARCRSSPADVVRTPVGALTLTFADGNNATFAYTVDAVAQTKQITRQVFRTPGTVCQ